MSLDPALPSSLKAILADITRRLRNLERSPRLTSASIRGGLLRVLDDAGKAVLEMGQRGAETVFRMNRPDGTAMLYAGRTSAGSQFFSLVDKGNRIVVSDDAIAGGLATPYIPVPFAPLDDVLATGFVYLETTDTSPKNIYFLRFYHQHPRLTIEGQLWAESGTSARLELVDEDGAVAWTSQTVTGVQEGFWPTIGADLLKTTSKLRTWRGLNLRIVRSAGTGRCGARLNAAVGIQS